MEEAERSPHSEITKAFGPEGYPISDHHMSGMAFFDRQCFSLKRPFSGMIESQAPSVVRQSSRNQVHSSCDDWSKSFQQKAVSFVRSFCMQEVENNAIGTISMIEEAAGMFTGCAVPCGCLPRPQTARFCFRIPLLTRTDSGSLLPFRCLDSFSST